MRRYLVLVVHRLFWNGNDIVMTPSLLFRAILLVCLIPGDSKGFSQSNGEEAAVLARIGPHTITVREYLDRLDLVPWPGKDNPSTRDSAKVKALCSLVAEKILSMHAVDQGVANHEATRGTLRSLERLLARDEMYRLEVLNAIGVTPDEIAIGADRYQFVLTLNSYIVQSEHHAHTLTAALNQRSSGQDVAIPTDGILSHDTITIRFGNLNEVIERAAYSLNSIGQAIALLAPRDGWIVLQLLEKTLNDAYLNATGQARHSAVNRIIRQRKEVQRVDAFLQPVFRESVALDPVLFHTIAESLRVILVADSMYRKHENTFPVSDHDIDTLKVRLQPLLDFPVARMADHSVSCDDVISELRYFPIRFASLRRGEFTKMFNELVQGLVEVGIISAEAMRRRMHLRPGVQRELRIWVEAMQANRMLQHLADSLGNITDSINSSAADNSSAAQIFKASEMMNQFLASVAERYGVEVYLDRLKNVRINPSNMVTKRFIGFGGVAAGVPMIPYLWEWIRVWEGMRSLTP